MSEVVTALILLAALIFAFLTVIWSLLTIAHTHKAENIKLFYYFSGLFAFVFFSLFFLRNHLYASYLTVVLVGFTLVLAWVACLTLSLCALFLAIAARARPDSYKILLAAASVFGLIFVALIVGHYF